VLLFSAVLLVGGKSKPHCDFFTSLYMKFTVVIISNVTDLPYSLALMCDLAK